MSVVHPKRLAPLVAVAVGVLALAGWTWDIEALKRGSPVSSTVNPLTAILLVVAGISLLGRDAGRARALRIGAAATVAAVALVALASVLLGSALAPDRLMFQDEPVRMAPMTALDLALAGSGLVLLDLKHRAAVLLAQVAGLSVLVTASVAVIGYMGGGPGFIEPAAFPPMAVLAAGGLEGLALGLLLAEPARGLLAPLGGSGAAARVGRVLMLAAVLVPVGLDWVRQQGQHLGWYGRDTGHSLTIIFGIGTTAALVWWAVHALRRTERQLQASGLRLYEANRLLGLAEQMGRIGHWRLNLRSGDIFWSDEVFRIHGLPRSTVVTKEMAIFAYHPDDRERVVQMVEAAISAGTEYTFELRLLRADGAVRHVFSAGQVERDAQGVVIALFGIFQDITDRKEAERERERLNERITLANHAARIGIWEWTLPDGPRVWDDAVLALYGLTAPVVPTFELWSSLLHPQDRDRVIGEFQAPLQHGLPFQSQFRVVWPDGTVRHLRAAGAVTHGSNGKPLRMVGSTWDVTDVQTLTHDLHDERARLLETVVKWTLAKDAAEDANRAKSDFLTAMSHELRTPMNGVLGFAQLLSGQRFGALNAKQVGCVAAILSSGKHLLRLIDDVLDLSRVESNKLSVSLEQVDLRPLLMAVLATLEQLAIRHDVSVDAGDLALGLPKVLADRTRLSQVLINLGSNAIKYNRPQGSVTFSYAVPEPGWLRVAVTDTGIGIPAERQHELFEPFNRLGAEQKAIEGTGIGLSLTRRLVGLMGGRIGFRSTQGSGSSFWVDIPVFHASNPSAIEVPATEVSDAPLPSGFSVLYVEDNPLNRALLRNALATLQDVHLIEADDGARGWAMAQEYRPDVIILDINLPDISGFALLQRLQRQPEFARTPILALSANAMTRDISRSAGAGFFRYLTKPVDVQELLQVIQQALDGIRTTEMADQG